MLDQSVLGVDIGGSGMKAAIVDLGRGELVTERFRIPTPKPGEPRAMSAVFGQLIEHFEWHGSIGSTFPGVIRNAATIETAANLDKSWVGVDAARLFGEHTPSTVTMVNDADAAGLAEVRLGAGQDVDGVVLLITIGTGLGTALFHQGTLIPNTELGHIEIDGVIAEQRASSRAREEKDLSTDVWAGELSRYLQRLEDLIWPDLFILGGGISKQFDEFGALLETRCPVVPAAMRNHAGIVGAAMAAG